jgi:hypothetical protein
MAPRSVSARSRVGLLIRLYTCPPSTQVKVELRLSGGETSCSVEKAREAAGPCRASAWTAAVLEPEGAAEWQPRSSRTRGERNRVSFGRPFAAARSVDAAMDDQK